MMRICAECIFTSNLSYGLGSEIPYYKDWLLKRAMSFPCNMIKVWLFKLLGTGVGWDQGRVGMEIHVGTGVW